MKPQRRNLFFLLVLLLVVFVIGFVLRLLQTTDVNNSVTIPEPTQEIFERKPATLTGEVVCLPHKNTSGPQTLECAIGLFAADGNYYALDTNLVPQDTSLLTTGNTIQASGIVTPIELLSTDQFMKYDVKGVLLVESLEVLE